MKFFFLNILYFIKNLFLSKKQRLLKRTQKQVEIATIKHYLSARELLNDIKKDILKEKYKIQTSKFIPLTRKNREEIRAMIYGIYGKQMKLHKIELTNELTFA